MMLATEEHHPVWSADHTTWPPPISPMAADHTTWPPHMATSLPTEEITHRATDRHAMTADHAARQRRTAHRRRRPAAAGGGVRVLAAHHAAATQERSGTQPKPGFQSRQSSYPLPRLAR